MTYWVLLLSGSVVVPQHAADGQEQTIGCQDLKKVGLCLHTVDSEDLLAVGQRFHVKDGSATVEVGEPRTRDGSVPSQAGCCDFQNDSRLRPSLISVSLAQVSQWV